MTGPMRLRTAGLRAGRRCRTFCTAIHVVDAMLYSAPRRTQLRSPVALRSAGLLGKTERVATDNISLRVMGLEYSTAKDALVCVAPVSLWLIE